MAVFFQDEQGDIWGGESREQIVAEIQQTYGDCDV